MPYRNAGDQYPPGSRIGPLTPYQRPLAMTLYFLIPTAAFIVLAIYLLGGDWIFKKFKYDKHSVAEVKHDTLETATSAHELLSELRDELRLFDKRSRDAFGPRHKWVKDGQRSETPTDIYDFVQLTKDEPFLKEYYEIGTARLEIDKSILKLESQIDVAASSIPKNATTENVFQAERLVRNNIAIVTDELQIQSQLLDQLIDKFKKGKQ